MGLVPIFHGRVTEDARLELEERERTLRQGHLKKLAGQRVDVIVRKHREKRSDRQLRWWKGIYLPLVGLELGYERNELEELHHSLLAICFGMKVDKFNQQIPNVSSTDELSTVQMSELMEWGVRWAAKEHGINVPLPNEAEFAA